MICYEECEPRRMRVAPRVPGLDDREFYIAWLVFRGYTNKEIARRIDRSYHTTKNRVSKILAKTGCRSRTDLSMWVIRVTGIFADR